MEQARLNSSVTGAHGWGAGSKKGCLRGFQARDAKGETKDVLTFALSTVRCRNIQYRYAGVSQDGGEDSPP